MKYVHSHWQNLNECRKCGEVCGPAWQGRAFRNVYSGVDAQGEPTGKPRVWHCEWHLFSRRMKAFALSLSFNGGDCSDDIMLHVAIPFLFSVYFGLEGYLPSNYKRGEREFSVSLDFGHGDLGTLGIGICRNPWEWNHFDAWWRHIYIDIADRLLGSEKYASEVIETYTGWMELPEGRYDLAIKEEMATWTRPKFLGLRLPFHPFFKQLRRFEIVPETAVPIPGKGENSWDCDDDAIYSMTVAAESADHAVHKFRKSVEERRKKYGWKDKAAA